MRTRAIAVTVLFVALVIGGLLCLSSSKLNSVTTSSTRSKSSVRLVNPLPTIPASLTAYSPPSTTASTWALQLTRQMTMDHLAVLSYNAYLAKLSAAKQAAAVVAATPPVTTPSVPDVATPVVPTSQSTVSTSTPPTIPSGDYDHRWDAVARCEEGGWIGYAGPAYPDSLGIDATNWYANGGGTDMSPAVQVAVAQRIEGTSFVPDQGGCASW